MTIPMISSRSRTRRAFFQKGRTGFMLLDLRFEIGCKIFHAVFRVKEEMVERPIQSSKQANRGAKTRDPQRTGRQLHSGHEPPTPLEHSEPHDKPPSAA